MSFKWSNSGEIVRKSLNGQLMAVGLGRIISWNFFWKNFFLPKLLIYWAQPVDSCHLWSLPRKLILFSSTINTMTLVYGGPTMCLARPLPSLQSPGSGCCDLPSADLWTLNHLLICRHKTWNQAFLSPTPCAYWALNPYYNPSDCPSHHVLKLRSCKDLFSSA